MLDEVHEAPEELGLHGLSEHAPQPPQGRRHLEHGQLVPALQVHEHPPRQGEGGRAHRGALLRVAAEQRGDHVADDLRVEGVPGEPDAVGAQDGLRPRFGPAGSDPRAHPDQREVRRAPAEVADQHELVPIEPALVVPGRADGFVDEADVREPGQGQGLAQAALGEGVVRGVVRPGEVHRPPGHDPGGHAAQLLLDRPPQIRHHQGDELLQGDPLAEDVRGVEAAAGEPGLGGLDEAPLTVPVDVALDGGVADDRGWPSDPAVDEVLRIEEHHRAGRGPGLAEHREGGELHAPVRGRQGDGGVGGAEVESDAGSGHARQGREAWGPHPGDASGSEAKPPSWSTNSLFLPRVGALQSGHSAGT